MPFVRLPIAFFLLLAPLTALAATAPVERPDCAGMWLEHATVRVRVDVSASLFVHQDEAVGWTLPEGIRAQLGSARPRAAVFLCHPGDAGREPSLEPLLSVLSEGAGEKGDQLRASWKVAGTLPPLAMRRYHVYLAPGSGPALGATEATFGTPELYSGENLVPNPGFELTDPGDPSNPAGWYVTGDVQQGATRIRGVRSAEAARTGSMGFRSYADGAASGPAEFGGRAVLADPIPVVPGVRYHLLVNARIVTATGHGLSVTAPFLDNDGRELPTAIRIESVPSQRTNGFEGFRAYTVAPPEARFVRLAIGTHKNEGTTDIDDVALFADPAGLAPPIAVRALNAEVGPQYRSAFPPDAGGAALLLDLGPRGSLVAGGFMALSPESGFTDGAQAGFSGAQGEASAGPAPDPLAQDHIRMNEAGTLSIRVPNGEHLVWMLLSDLRPLPTAELGLYRSVVVLKAEGESKGVIDKRLDFAAPRPLTDDDALALRKGGPEAMWQRWIEPRIAEALFPVTVEDGVLELSCGPAGACPLAAVGVFTGADRGAVMKALATFTERRRTSFILASAVPEPSRVQDAIFLPTAAERDRGFVPFALDTDEDVYPETTPTRAAADAAAKGLHVRVARGEATAVAVGVWASAYRADATLTVAQPETPIGDGIGQAFDVRAVAYQAVRSGDANDARFSVRPVRLVATDKLDLHPKLARTLWVSITVPPDAAPGEYDGALLISAGRGRDASVPITVEVLPVDLPASPFRQGVLGTEWAPLAATMADLAAHGMDLVPLEVAPGVQLDGTSGGVAVDFAQLDEAVTAARSAMAARGAVARDLGRAAFGLLGAAARTAAGFDRLYGAIVGQAQTHAEAAGWPALVQYVTDPTLLPLCGTGARCVTPSEWSAGRLEPAAGDVVVVGPAADGSLLADAAKKALARDKRPVWLLDHGAGRVGRGLLPWAMGASAVLQGGYASAAGDPHNPWDDEGAPLPAVLPEGQELAPTLRWERARLGVTDARWIALVEELSARAKQAGGAAKKEAAAAEAALGKIKSSIPLTIPAESLRWDRSIRLEGRSADEIREELVTRALALRAALGE